ncbi:GNAT family N-acetyltransferase [Microbacterium resistens]|uniref:GNAT family N-acetyltransferase n=1 Tax=Microbacterium resistens TaxID=156977 RepID=UPI00366DEF56
MTPPVTVHHVPTDRPEQLSTVWRILDAAYREGRPDAVPEPEQALLARAQSPSPYTERRWFLAEKGGEPVGAAELAFSLADNPHLATLALGVQPPVWRRGIGRALHERLIAECREAGRRTILAEVSRPMDARGIGAAFAESLGYRVVHTEHVLRLDVPGADGPAAPAAPSRPDEAYEILGWTDRCPEEFLAAYLAMRNQMNADVPLGEIDIDPVVLDEERLRVSEERTSAGWRSFVAAARARSTGEFAGYSVLMTPRDDARVARQDDTLVMPAHRGHGLGGALKRDTLARLRKQAPECRVVYTWTDPANTAMYRTNEAFGYRPVEVMHEVELTGF